MQTRFALVPRSLPFISASLGFPRSDILNLHLFGLPGIHVLHVGKYFIQIPSRPFLCFLWNWLWTTFIPVMVALTGLLGLYVALFDVLHSRKLGGGKLVKGKVRQSDQGLSSTTNRKTFHPYTTRPGCCQNVPGQDLRAQCFRCLTPLHNMNTRGPC